jgi:integrase
MKTTGKGYLFQRGRDSKGNPTGNYSLRYVIHGKTKLISLGTANKIKAEAKRDEILTPALMATSSEKVTRHIAEARELLTDVKYTLETVWKQYLKSPKRPQSSEGTLENYKRCWDMFVKWLEENHRNIKKVNQITAKEAEAYAEHVWMKAEPKKKKDEEEKELTAEEKKLARGITANTFNYHIQALNLIFKIIFNKLETPFTGIERKKEEKINRKNFSDEQLKKIFASFNDPLLIIPNKAEIKLLCYIGACTGLRLVDAVHMKWDQVDFANKMISALPIKTRGIQRNVHIPLHPELKVQLDLAETKDKGGYVMPSIVERYQQNPDGIVDDFHKVLDLKSVGLKEIQEAKRGKSRRLYSFHSLRHSFASFAANAGVPITTLASILGDSARTLEKYYIKASDESKTKAVMALPALTVSSETGTVIDVKPISVLSNNVKHALNVIKHALANDKTGELKKELIKILQLPLEVN